MQKARTQKSQRLGKLIYLTFSPQKNKKTTETAKIKRPSIAFVILNTIIILSKNVPVQKRTQKMENIAKQNCNFRTVHNYILQHF